MKIYDSLSAKKVDYTPGKTIKMYVCGPTVYDHAHLGHGRSAVVFDLVRRYFEFLGHEVVFVSNITDIDDKMIKRANEEGISVDDLANKIIPEYEKDYGELGIKAPTKKPRATEFIKEMISIIKTLEEKGCTYLTSDGVYFDIKKFPGYGKLSHQNLDELNAGARVEENKEKRNHQDFVLWKLKKDNEPFWPSPWGEGRPGWHIECSAMSSTLLGETFDIHGGGLDLKFPHHECEIAQSEAANEKPLANIWMHNGFITVNEEKMSKSLGNFFLLKDIFKKYHPRVVRFFLLSSHYRSPIEFSDQLLEQARNSLKSLDDIYLKNEGSEIDEELISKVKEKMDSDFDVAGVFGVIFEWLNSKPSNVKGTLEKLNQLLNIFPADFKLNNSQKTLIEEREKARAEKNWARSDEIRNQLASEGVEIEDSKEGCFAKPKI